MAVTAVRRVIPGAGLDYRATLEHHDKELTNLAGRVGSLEVKLDAGFASVREAIAQQKQGVVSLKDAVSVVLSLAVLFSMVVGGIIWVTTNQFAGMVAEQKSMNMETKSRIERHDVILEKLTERVGWSASTTTKRPAER